MLSANTILQNRYQIIRQLGQGGMGTVYEALDQRVSAVIALKQTRAATNEESLRAFEREAALLANLRHQSLPKVMDYFVEDGGEFLVMEFIPGNDLAELLELRGSAFELHKVLGWADRLLEVLEYLHERQPPILHRDIKPSNLKLTKQGELFLIDFGLAKGAAGQMSTMQTSHSVYGYTPVYASLEQIHGQGTDPRSDLYSLAATIYHLLTAVAPIAAPKRFTAIEDEQPDPLKPIDELNPLVSPFVARVIHKAMAISRRQRFASAVEMRKALRRAVEDEQREKEERTRREAEAKEAAHEEERKRREEEAWRVEAEKKRKQEEAAARRKREAEEDAARQRAAAERAQAEATERRRREAEEAERRKSANAPALSPPISPAAPSPKNVEPVSTNPNSVTTNERARIETGGARTDARPASLTATLNGKGKPARLWPIFTVPVVLLLLLAVLGGYWMWFSPERTLIPFRKGDKFGFSDTNQKLYIEAKYEDAQPFRDGLASVKLNGKYGFIDKTGKAVIPLKYDKVERFTGGLAIVALDKKYGFIDKTGKEVIPLKYDEAEAEKEVPSFIKDTPLDPNSKDETLLSVKLNSKWGFIDKTGNQIIPFKYDRTDQFSEGLASVAVKGEKEDLSDSKKGFIDKTGREVTPIKYDKVEPFIGGLAVVGLNKKYGFIDKTGNEVIPLKYDMAETGKGLFLSKDANSNGERLLNVMLNGKWGFIDKTGNEVIPFKYDGADSFVEGLASVTLNKKYGFIDKMGREVIPLKYDEAGYFNGELATVRLNGKWGYIDKTGREVIPLQYEKLGFGGFTDGLAAAKLNGKWGFIDKAGNFVIAPKFDASEKSDSGPIFNNGIAVVTVNKKYGYVHKTGKEITEFKYDMGQSFNEELASVTLNSKTFYIDKNGTEYYEP